jgi:hypothetical protein
VCRLYAGGFPIAEAVVEARDHQREWNPCFEPRYEPELLTL